jgi:hypothetical protein
MDIEPTGILAKGKTKALSAIGPGPEFFRLQGASANSHADISHMNM